MISSKPGKQRKRMFNAPLHKKRKWIAAHLEENLLLKYDRRAVPVVKGDTVRVMRGSFRGHEDKVARVNVKKGYLEIEGITMIKADGNKIAKPIHPSNVMITKLNLTDKWRRKKLEKGLSEEAKKEIEKEAEEQIKEVEEERKRLEKELEEKEAEEELEEPIKETTEEKGEGTGETVPEEVKEEKKETKKNMKKENKKGEDSVKKKTSSSSKKKNMKKTSKGTTKKKEEKTG